MVIKNKYIIKISDRNKEIIKKSICVCAPKGMVLDLDIDSIKRMRGKVGRWPRRWIKNSRSWLRESNAQARKGEIMSHAIVAPIAVPASAVFLGNLSYTRFPSKSRH